MIAGKVIRNGLSRGASRIHVTEGHTPGVDQGENDGVS
jgi:hypothetical protein